MHTNLHSMNDEMTMSFLILALAAKLAYDVLSPRTHCIGHVCFISIVQLTHKHLSAVYKQARAYE